LQISRTRLNQIDIEGVILSVIAILIARAIILSTVYPAATVFSIILAFTPLFILAFKLVHFLQEKNVFDQSQMSIKISLFGLFIILIAFSLITLLNYFSHSYVLYTFILSIFFTAFGPKISFSKRLPGYLSEFANAHKSKHNYLIYCQAALIIFNSVYLMNMSSPIPPNKLDFLHLMPLCLTIIIPAYLIFVNSKLKDISILMTTVLLFTFMAIQGMVYYGGDTGFSVSVTKYLLNGNDAGIVSPHDKWRFGNATFLGFPSISAYLSEAAQLNPEFAISFANGIGIVFAVIGGYALRNLLGRNEFEKSFILMTYLLAQPAIFYFIINPFRASSLLLLVLPLTIPLFSGLRFNKFGKLAFIAAMFSVLVIHPLSFPIIIIMLLYLAKNLQTKEMILLVCLVVTVMFVLILGPTEILRTLSVSSEESISLAFKNSLGPIIAPLPNASSVDWPGAFTIKISLVVTIITLLALLFVKIKDFPRLPLIGIIIFFFILSSLINTANFPVDRLAMFVTSIGVVIIGILSIRYLVDKISFKKQIIKSVLISALCLIIIANMLNSYPQGRALALDALNLKEYELLKSFVEKEKTNFDESLIFAHLETIRYLNGVQGSILYFGDSPKAFHFDFTNRQIAIPVYSAFTNSIGGDFSAAIKLASQKDAKFVYVVLLHRFVPQTTSFGFGDTVAKNDAGEVRKISFTAVEPSQLMWEIQSKGVEKVTSSFQNDSLTFSGIFVKNYTAVLATAKFDKPIKTNFIACNVTYFGSVTPRIFLVFHNNTGTEVLHDKISGQGVMISSTFGKDNIDKITIMLDSGRKNQFGDLNQFPFNDDIKINKIWYIQ